jgi:hypothetical protein
MSEKVTAKSEKENGSKIIMDGGEEAKMCKRGQTLSLSSLSLFQMGSGREGEKGTVSLLAIIKQS